MDSLKSVIGVAILIIFLVIGFQLFDLLKQNFRLKSDLSDLNQQEDRFAKENETLKADLEYLANPANLIKELKSKLNFKAPGEKVIIIVPPKDRN